MFKVNKWKTKIRKTPRTTRSKKSNKPTISKELEAKIKETYDIASPHLSMTLDEFRGHIKDGNPPEGALSVYTLHAEFLRKFKQAFEFATYAQESEAFLFTLRCEMQPIALAWDEVCREVLTKEQREWLLKAYTDFVRQEV